MSQVVRKVVEEVLGRSPDARAAPAGGEPPRPNYQRQRALARMAELSSERPQPAGASAPAQARIRELGSELKRQRLTAVPRPEASSGPASSEPAPPPARAARPVAGGSRVVWRLGGDDGVWWLDAPHPDAVPESVRAVVAAEPTVVVAIARPRPRHVLETAEALAELEGARVLSAGSGRLLLGVTHGDVRALGAWARQTGSRLERAALDRRRVPRILGNPPPWAQALLGIPAVEAVGWIEGVAELDAVVLADLALGASGGLGTRVTVQAGHLVVTGSRPDVAAMLEELERQRVRLRIPSGGDR